MAHLPTPAERNLARLFKNARESVEREWSKAAFEKLGTRLQRALLCEAVLELANLQDPSVSDEVVRTIVEHGYTWAVYSAGY